MFTDDALLASLWALSPEGWSAWNNQKQINSSDRFPYRLKRAFALGFAMHQR
jgi:hypothetical protein